MGKIKTENGSSDDRRKSPPPKASQPTNVKKKPLSNEEKQRKLAEMMANASWRDEQRTARVMAHRRDQAREEAEHQGAGVELWSTTNNFMTQELAQAQEGRLTANKYRRGHGDMDRLNCDYNVYCVRCSVSNVINCFNINDVNE